MHRQSQRGPRVAPFVSFTAALLACAAFAPSARAQACSSFQESGGLLVVEIESVAPTGSWVSETSNGGYTGASYYRWSGPDQFSSPGQGVLRYEFDVQTPGTYRLAVHNRHDHPDSSLENDAWLRVDGGSWVKCYSNSGSGITKQWIWDTEFEVGGTHLPPDVPLSVGHHVLEFSGRSHNFMMDRFHLALPGHPDAKNKFAAQSACSGTGAGNASVYCKAKTNSQGCKPAVSVPQGQPSVSAGSGWVVIGRNLINQQPGIFIYGDQDAAMPFQGGALCVRPPFTRTPAKNTGGSGSSGSNCLGQLTFDVPAWIATGQDPTLVPGASMYGQFWYRDGNASFGSGLTNAAAMVLQP
jgi:hypothetical protein